jgi:RNA polymerase sigma factor (sigma-70 family)
VHVEPSGETDAELLAQVAAGSRHALGAVFDRHGAAVTRYAWALASSRPDVEEIVQDTLVTTWQKAGSIVLAETSLLPWLLVTCRNHALNLARRSRRRAADSLPDDSEHENSASVRADAEAAEEARDTLRWVMAEIEKLEPLDRQICRLCLLEGHSYGEAAATLGLSADAVKKRVSRARIRLRKGVADHAN